MTSNPHKIGSNVFSLTGIPLDGSASCRIRDESVSELYVRLEQQVLAMQCEVGDLHKFAETMGEHGDELLQGVAIQTTVFMRHFDTRLNEIESIVTSLAHRQREAKP